MVLMAKDAAGTHFSRAMADGLSVDEDVVDADGAQSRVVPVCAILDDVGIKNEDVSERAWTQHAAVDKAEY